MEKLKIIVDDKGKVQIYMNGKEVKGVIRFTFECGVGELPRHEIEYLTDAT